MAKNIVKIPTRNLFIPTSAKRIVNIRISNKALKETLEDKQRKLVKLTETPELSEAFADALIASARKITPYRDEYPLKKRQVVKKDGKKKYIKDVYTKNRQYDPDKTEDYYDNPSKFYTIRSKHKRLSSDILSSLEQEQEGLTLKELDINRMPTKGRSGLETAKLRTKKNQELKRLRKEQEAFAKTVKSETKKAKAYKRDERPMADRPPHLRDSGYAYSYQGGKVGIVYSVKKEKDDAFVSNSKEALKDYANKQYYSQDVNWKRFTKGTASRWLEQAVGVDIGPGYKKAAINGEANYKKLIKIFQKGVSDALK